MHRSFIAIQNLIVATASVSESAVAIRPENSFWRSSASLQSRDHENFFVAKPRDSESVQPAFSRHHRVATTLMFIDHHDRELKKALQ
jgi:hypothetical protein